MCPERTRTGWLGRQDSDPGMTESKSTYSAAGLVRAPQPPTPFAGCLPATRPSQRAKLQSYRGMAQCPNRRRQCMKPCVLSTALARGWRRKAAGKPSAVGALLPWAALRTRTGWPRREACAAYFLHLSAVRAAFLSLKASVRGPGRRHLVPAGGRGPIASKC
jgi:hypothetical protein